MMDKNLPEIEEIDFDFEPEIAGELCFSLTQNAVQKLKQIKQSAVDSRLRIKVLAGGCSGYQYEFILQKSDNANPDDNKDFVICQDGAEVIIDKISAGYLQNAILDYPKTLAGESFQLVNPNIANSCGCGTSFSV